MKSIIFKNEAGETIEVKRGAGGQILVKHSDIASEKFGEFVELAPTWELASMRIPELHPHLDLVKKLGFDATIIIDGRTTILNANEVKAIRAAIKQLAEEA
jgi:transcriptional regulator CtsR